jgi:multidrug efflux system membrane fusion protein
VAGQDVKAGDLLFEIDPRPFEAAVHEAQARLERDTALANNDQVDADRIARLLVENAAPQEEADKARYRAESSKATVRADQAMLDNARLQLEYTKIHSPIDARAGWVMTDRGNIVKFDETQLLVLNQIKPINVAFNVPEQDLDQIRARMKGNQLDVEVIVPPDTRPSERGKLSFIDNRVDSDTGTIRLKATFDNQSGRLWPGQFVQASLNLNTESSMAVVPSRAIQTGQDGLFVFVLSKDMTVEMRPVKVRRAIGDDIVIDTGLAAGERVVTEGQLRLVPGSKVRLKDAPTTAPSTRTAGKENDT